MFFNSFFEHVGLIYYFLNRLVHWDVNNEHIHNPFFEETASDPWYTETMVREVHAHDPDTKLFYNEFHVLSKASLTYVSYA